MNYNQNSQEELEFLKDTDCTDNSSLSELDRLERQLENDLEVQMNDLKMLNETEKNIGNPESLGKVVGDEIWHQFLNQAAAIAGEESVAEYRNTNTSNNHSYYSADKNDIKDFSKGKKLEREDGNTEKKDGEKTTQTSDDHDYLKQEQESDIYDHERTQEVINEVNNNQSQSFQVDAKGAGKKASLILFRQLAKDVIAKLIQWLKKGKLNLSSFLESVKEAVKKFIEDLKKDPTSAIKDAGTALLSTILGPIVGTVKKIWALLKTGWKSLKEAYKYLTSPARQNQPFTVTLLEVSKILIGGLVAGGGLVLGEAIEKGFINLGLNFPLGPFGSFAGLMGMFLGALISGVVGAIALNFIDKVLAKKRQDLTVQAKIDKNNQIIATQNTLINIAIAKKEEVKQNVAQSIAERHLENSAIFQDELNGIMANVQQTDSRLNETCIQESENKQSLDDIFNSLNKI